MPCGGLRPWRPSGCEWFEGGRRHPDHQREAGLPRSRQPLPVQPLATPRHIPFPTGDVSSPRGSSRWRGREARFHHVAQVKTHEFAVSFFDGLEAEEAMFVSAIFQPERIIITNTGEGQDGRPFSSGVSLSKSTARAGAFHVDSCTPCGAAATAGLCQGDLVLAVNNVPANGPPEVAQSSIDVLAPGEQVVVAVRRPRPSE